MSNLAHDALYLVALKLVRLAREGKIHTTEADAPEVASLLSNAAGAIDLAGGPHLTAPLPQILPAPTIEAQPVERRKDW